MKCLKTTHVLFSYQIKFLSTEGVTGAFMMLIVPLLFHVALQTIIELYKFFLVSW